MSSTSPFGSLCQARIGACLLALALVSACGSSPPEVSAGSQEEEAPSSAEAPAPEEAPASEEAPAPEEAPALPEPAAAERALHWTLSASLTTLSMADRSSFRLRIEVTNQGAEASVPTLHLGHFLLDGRPSRLLDMAFSNGVMEPGWMSLEPGSSVSTERAVGESLFPAPGRYLLAYERGGSRSEVRVRVTR